MNCIVPILVTIFCQDGTSSDAIQKPEKTFEGHAADVHDVAFGPSGELLATASFDRSVKLWSLAEGTAIATFEGHKGKVFTVDFSPDGGRVLSASEDKTIKLWGVPRSGPAERFASSGAFGLGADARHLIYSETRDGKHIAVLRSLDDPKEVYRFALSAAPERLMIDAGGTIVVALSAGKWHAAMRAPPPPEPLKPDGAKRDLLARGARWRYFKGKQQPPAEWRGVGFDASKWTEGASGFGYSSNAAELATVATKLDDMRGGSYLSLYLRGNFSLEDPSRVTALDLSVTFDDAFVAYLNGKEIGRRNIDGKDPDHKATGKAASEPEDVRIDLAAFISQLRKGENVLAIQGHNANVASSDFVLTPTLSAVIAAPPEPPSEVKAATTLELGAAQFVVVREDGQQIAVVLPDRISIRSVSIAGKAPAGSEVSSLPVAKASALVFLPRNRIAIARDDSVETWSLDSKQRERELKGHSQAVTALSARGEELLSGDASGTLKHWDSSSGAQKREIKAHEGKVTALAFAADGRRWITAADKELAVWNATDGKKLSSYSSPSSVRAVSSIGGERYLASVEGRLLEWSPKKSGEIRTLSGHGGIVHMAVFSPDGKTAASASSDKTVRIWNVEDGKQLRSITAHDSSVYCVAYRGDGSLLASAGYDGIVKVWDAGSGKELHKLKGHREGVSSLVFSEDGASLFSSSFDGTIRRWNYGEYGKAGEDGKAGSVKIYEGHPGWVLGIALDGGGKTLSSVDFGGNLMMWNLDDGKTIRRGKLPPVVYDLALSPDGRWLAAAHRRGAVLLIRLKD